MTLIVQARGHRRQQLTIIKILIYLDETNKYINLGMMISLKNELKITRYCYKTFYYKVLSISLKLVKYIKKVI